MRLSPSEQYKIFNQAFKAKRAFSVDWKSQVKDIVFNIKSILPELDINSTPEKQVLGVWQETLLTEGKEYPFDSHSETLILDVIDTINKHLKNHNLAFVLLKPDDDYSFILINLSEVEEYLEKGFLKL